MHGKSQTGIIIKVEYAGDDNLELGCSRALRQIDEHHHTDALKEYDPEKVYKYAIACCRKHSMVTLEEEDWKTR